MRSALIAALLVAGACNPGGPTTTKTPSETDPPPPRPVSLPVALTFDAIDIPESPSPEVVASTGAKLGGQALEVTWHPLLHQGQDLGGTRFGELVDEAGNPLAEKSMCGHADFNGLVDAHGELWHLGHIECMPGALWLTKLARSEQGTLTPVSSAPVDLSGVHGGKHFCAGDVTPWGSVLSGEEYDADASRMNPDGSFVEGYDYEDYDPARMGQYYTQPGRLPVPYDHGWVVETTITDAQGGTKVEKRFGMGRYSHEIAYLMPDDRTVYLSDDGVNGGLFLYVADKAGDLSAGTLYAARWTQTSASGGGSGKLSWISLGHSTDEALGKELAAGALHFDEVLSKRVLIPPGEDDTDTDVPPMCPEGHTAINDAWGPQCLKLVDGVDPVLASRVETRRVAAMKGATVEFRKGEGITYDPDHRAVYIALAEVNKGMIAASPQWDIHGPDHIQVEENRCGGVYAMPVASGVQDTDGQPIASELVATEMAGFVMGDPEGFGCSKKAPSNPDNITYLPGSGVLMIAEDSKHRDNDLLWAVQVGPLHAGRPSAPKTPILAVPPGAEVTGIHWYPDLRGHGYLTATVQHPWERTDEEEGKTLEERMGTFGYFGPFPKLAPAAE